MEEVTSDFEFLSGHFLYHQSDDVIKKHAFDLAIKYSKDLDGTVSFRTNMFQTTSVVTVFRFKYRISIGTDQRDTF